MIEFREMLDDGAFRNLSWAQKLQNAMRARGLSDAGRLISPVLRPCFLSGAQVDRLAEACVRVSSLFNRLETTFSKSPEWMQRLRMLPSEKVLAAQECECPRTSFATSIEAVIQNGTLRLSSIETCSPVGLGVAHELSELFSETPVVSKLRKSGYSVAPVSTECKLLPSVHKMWCERGVAHPPRIAVMADHANTEARFLAAMLSEDEAPAEICPPEQFVYQNGSLLAANKGVDLVFRRVSARDLLVQSGLAHPLLRAYQEGSACVVNSFRSEVGRRRVLLEFLTEPALRATLSPSERETVESYIPWTRVISRRKTTYCGEEIDLIPFASRHRSRFSLSAIEDGGEKQTYNGADCSDTVWHRTLQTAAPGAWLLQEQPAVVEPFPVMHYGDLQIKKLQVSIHAHVIAGELRGAVAQLSLPSAGCARPVALAPVFSVTGRA